MMLVQKPPYFPLDATPLRHHHRRHPSSPPVVHVKPTQTPGLLSLSRPQQQHQQQRTPTPRKDKQPRSTPSQAEGNSDPFFVPKHTKKQAPISIPFPSPSPQHQVARSVPLPQHRPAKRTAIPKPLQPAFDFPICDDLSDNESPSTPTRPPKQHRHTRTRSKRTPQPQQQQQQPQSSPVPSQRTRNHKRAPSDSAMIFQMSSDESGPETQSDELNALFTKMALARKNMGTPPPAAERERMFEAMAQREVRGYFASSSFQNSPSPEDLPDPSFI
ncbi:hypothetical protein H0H93_000827 [Arthromyces matolae]|nr:hypothetical protein H0H93_000827 [Arthromyces matolae]